jgi:hypothetical protein
MKHFKDLNACIAHLRAIHGRDDIEPEQKKELEGAIECLRRFRRKNNPSQAELFNCVREVAGRLVEAFFN